MFIDAIDTGHSSMRGSVKTAIVCSFVIFLQAIFIGALMHCKKCYTVVNRSGVPIWNN